MIISKRVTSTGYRRGIMETQKQETSGRSRHSKKRANLRKRLMLNYEMYIFLALPLIYLVIFEYWLMFGAHIAFRRFNPTQGIWHSEWVGLENFKKFFNSYQFTRVLINTLRVSIYSMVAGFPIPIFFALALNSLKSAVQKKTIQNITYIPYFISTVVLVGMIIQLFNARIGLFARSEERRVGKECRLKG